MVDIINSDLHLFVIRYFASYIKRCKRKNVKKHRIQLFLILSFFSLYLLLNCLFNKFYYTNASEPDIILTYKSILVEEGYNVNAFTDPREALRHFAQLDPLYYKLILLDIRMPSLNGFQLYYRLKAINPTIRVLFVSALDAAQEMVSILPDVKLDDIVRKPIDNEQFLHKVKMTLAT